jgi:cytochrome c553
MFVATAGFAAAQTYAPPTDILGAHLNYGRGCAACHAPHSGAYGNGIAKNADTTSGNTILWGENVEPLYGQTLTFAGGRAETLPTDITASPTGITSIGNMPSTSEATGILTCLSCHDGNLAEGAMMQNKVYEQLPWTYGTANPIPTLLGNDGTTKGNYLNDHPVGSDAKFGCNATTASGGFGESGYNWDCTLSGTAIVAGPNMAQFINNYGFFVQLGTSTATTSPIVVCTSCHNQHSMNVVNVAQTTGVIPGSAVSTGLSGITPGTYQTMFFLRGPYNPSNLASNTAAQFCRQCHGGESNEMNGGGKIPTTW